MAADPQPAGPGSALTVPSGGDVALIVVAVAAVSTSGPLVVAAVAPALAVAFWRNAMASGLLAGLAAGRPALRAELRRLSPGAVRLSLAGGLLLGLHFATWVPSLRLTSVASSTALVATQPVWAALIARLRGETVPGLAWVGIALALLGAVSVTGVDVLVSLRAVGGDGLALAGAVFAAGYVTVGAGARRTVSTSAYTLLCYSTCSVVLAVGCLAARASFAGYPARTWLELAAMTVGPQLLGHSMFNRLLRTTSPTVVSLAILFEVPGASLIAALALHQRLHLDLLPCLLLLLAGVALVVRAGTRLEAVD